LQFASSLIHRARAPVIAVLILVCAGIAHGADRYDAASRRLSIPTLAIGGGIYSNVVLTVGSLVSGPTGSTPAGSEDSYDPATNRLTVQTVTVGPATYYNAVITVAGLVSIGAVAGVDSYAGIDLSIPSVLVLGGPIYSSVVVTVGVVVSAGGGMPHNVRDLYDPASNQLTIAAIELRGTVYTNAIITVGSLVSVSSSSPTESTLHSFTGNQYGGTGANGDGATPFAGLIQGIDGNFYGTAYSGGASGMGAVFNITAAGVESVFYSFGTNSEDGANPTAALIQDGSGNFYGTTTGGGGYLAGTVFKISAAGVETVLYSFGTNGSMDGALPEVGLVRYSDGIFYGTTEGGGAYNRGTVFKITAAGVETVLHSFSGHSGLSGSVDAASPQSSLILGSDGNFYGTTTLGGAYDQGTVFSVNIAGVETVLHSFGGNGGLGGSTDGADPATALVQASDGTFYGATSAGGVYDRGTFFRINAAGTETALYSFGTNSIMDGSGPSGGLVQGSDGKFYGTTYGGGISGAGTAFKITAAGVETVVHNFGGPGLAGGSADGVNPESGLSLGADGNFYGTTTLGGAHNKGSVFMLMDVISNP
jgi:uncharacterized repeat protein (TIGR03803 family)